ncbi:MAG: hypothetical protein Q8L86_10405 [Vicinamibacterales bacterium]|nr:hypothetical protein [Vicinamibacterales bacterium]
MGLTLVRGRFLNDADHEDAMPAVVINDTMAGRYWPGEDALGRQSSSRRAGPPRSIRSSH